MSVFPKDTAKLQARYSAKVNAERDRRVVLGRDFVVTAHPDPIAMEGRPEDTRNLMNLAMAAQVRLAADPATTETTEFRDKDNVHHVLTQPQLLELWQMATAYVSALYAASWTLKEMPHDTDVTLDEHWPIT